MKTVTGVICPKCDEFVWSRYQHDFRACGCGYTKADGGPELQRVVWGRADDNPGAAMPEIETREVEDE